MADEPENVLKPVRSPWFPWPVRYGGALLAVAAALGLWSLSPQIHHDPFSIFVLAVVFTARFLGFGPALLGTALSVVAIDYVVFEPRFSLSVQGSEIARLLLFVFISVLAASIARARSQAEVRADEMHERMAAIVESSEDAIYSTTPEGVITTWNHGAETLYGYNAAEVLGRSVLLTVPPELAHETRFHLELLTRGESVESYQTKRRRKDESLVNILLSVSPLRDRKGAVIGASAIASDITSQLRAEEALRRSEKLATAGRLTAAIAHEINNPLEAITNLLYLARRDSSRADRHLEMAEREVQRIADIAQQTLGYVRDFSDARPVKVSLALDNVLRLFAVKLNGKKIQTRKEFAGDCEVLGFDGELRQLFSNLIVNAADAMPNGGRLRLRVTPSREWSGEHRAGVRIVVADNGTGIQPKDRTRVFEPFYTTKKDSGTGLGLWLSEGIVHKHGGEIRVRSSTHPARRGTVFSIFLPAVATTIA